MHPLLFSITQVESIWEDLPVNDGMDPSHLPDLRLADITTRLRSKLNLNKKADLRRAIAHASDNSANFKIINGVAAKHLFQTVNVLPRANFRFEFSSLKLEATTSLQDLAHHLGYYSLRACQ
jgi:fatty acid synthase subunit alpha